MNIVFVYYELENKLYVFDTFDYTYQIGLKKTQFLYNVHPHMLTWTLPYWIHSKIQVQLWSEKYMSFKTTRTIMDRQDTKRIKFSPTTIDQIESDTISRLCVSVDRYAVPDSFIGKEPGPWDMPHSQFPAPSSLQDAAQLHLFQLNYRGCPLYYTCMQCSCPNCTDM